MKTIEEYMRLPYRLEIVPDTEEGGFVAGYPELPGCLTTGETLAEAATNAQDAKRAWLEAALADGVPIAEPVRPNTLRRQSLERILTSPHPQP